MAERRMFHMSVVESDVFLDMPAGAQALYFHMGMHADDDGFVNGPKQICRMVGVPQKYIRLLEEKGFLLCFEKVVVIRHWLMANTLKKDRMRPLQYPDIADRIYILASRLYSDVCEDDCLSLLETRKNFVDSRNLKKSSKMEHKRREGKVSQGKVSQDNTRKENLNEDKAAVAAVPAEPGAAAAADSALCIMNGELGKGVVLLTQDQIADLLDRMGIDSFDYYVDKLASFILHSRARVKNHYATIVKWWSQDKECMQ